eukprot:8470927-Pyramimonas_sp.AAC.1
MAKHTRRKHQDRLRTLPITSEEAGALPTTTPWATDSQDWYRTGARPASSYGVEVDGLPDAELGMSQG